MPARRRTTFPGLDPRAAKEIIALQDDLLGELQALRQEAIGSTTDTKQSGTYPVRFNERVRVSPTATGVDLTFPAASSQNQNKWLEVLVLTAGNVRLRATAGLIQGAVLLTLTAVGFYYFQSDGFSGWWMQPTGGGGGGSQGWDDTLAIDPTSGANNPIVSAGQFLQMGAVGPTSLNAQIRSGDSPFRIHGGAQLTLVGDTNVVALAQGGAFSASGTTTASLAGGTAVALSTAATLRLMIEADGSWNIGGSNGAAGNVLTSNGAALPPTWQAAAAGGSLALLTTEVNLGSVPTWSGSFTIAGAGMTIGKPVLIQQAVGPYTGKGTLADEAEDQVAVTASVTSAVLITAYWRAVATPLIGNVKFYYAVSA